MENPQIPAATSMANMISRKKKNCTIGGGGGEKKVSVCASMCVHDARKCEHVIHLSIDKPKTQTPPPERFSTRRLRADMEGEKEGVNK